jgi:hypothetical protein
MRFFTRVKLLIGYCDDENTLSKYLIGKSPIALIGYIDRPVDTCG